MTTPNDPLVDALLALQAFEGLTDPPKTDATYDLQLAKLRNPLPVSVLMHHYDRRQRKKRSITTARNGVCGHCHLAVPRALVLQMSRSGALGTCPQCEGFLYIERESAPELTAKKAAPRKRKATRKSPPESAIAEA